jgi:hypothetical protein
MYEALKRRGYAVQENAIKPATFAEDGTLVSDGNFVFKVTAGPRSAEPQPAAAEAPAPTPEPARDVPRSFMKKMKVDHDVYIRDERRWETVKVPAHTALKSVREDIGNLEALLKCMKG